MKATVFKMIRTQWTAQRVAGLLLPDASVSVSELGWDPRVFIIFQDSAVLSTHKVYIKFLFCQKTNLILFTSVYEYTYRRLDKYITKYIYLLIDISQKSRKRFTKRKPVITEWGQKDGRSLTVSPDINTDFDHHLWIRGSLWGSRSLAEARQHAARTQRLKTGFLTEG